MQLPDTSAHRPSTAEEPAPRSDGTALNQRVVLHRCPLVFLRRQWQGCNAVQKALDQRGVPDELQTAPFRKGRRHEVIQASGQPTAPTIVFADGTAYRDEGKTMAAQIRAGRLFEHRGDVPQSSTHPTKKGIT